MKNESAFPVVLPDYVAGGLTKREYFAAIAMQGILANPECMGLTDSETAKCAIGNADALIQELSKEESIDEHPAA